jgi:DNA repair exonuclease SbcCD ATPase subunit
MSNQQLRAPCGECRLQAGERCDVCGAKQDHADLMAFYGVKSLAELVAVQAKSIERLQERLSRAERLTLTPTRPRA